jgi:hypothetical protein
MKIQTRIFFIGKISERKWLQNTFGPTTTLHITPILKDGTPAIPVTVKAEVLNA